MSPPDPVTLASGPAENVTVKLGIQNDATGGEPDETVSLGLELVEPTDFSDLIVLDGVVDGATSKLTITIKDDDRKSNCERELHVKSVEYRACACTKGLG